MQFDFHYCAIKVLARCAGFDEAEAQVIAFASQYADDAVEHLPLQVIGLPDVPGLRRDGPQLDPICTAHKVLRMVVASGRKDSQRKVYIPFHFVPAEPYGGQGEYDYTVQCDSSLSRRVVWEALSWIQDNPGDRRRGLIKLGLALHTFADTWAHSRFSGRRSRLDNDILSPQAVDTDLSTAIARVAAQVQYTEIGHAQAGHLPDQSDVRWGCRHRATGTLLRRANSAHFLAAAEQIYRLLAGANHRQPESLDQDVVAAQLGPALAARTRTRSEARCVGRRSFPGIRLSYSEQGWRREALTGGRLDFHRFHARDYEQAHYRFAGGMEYLWFHAAALEQREFVLARIRTDLR